MLELKNISKSYGDFSLKDINLRVEDGEYFVLLGRSGAGKSQLLEIIAGLRKPDSGSVILDGKDITYEKIQNRKTGMVFQDFALFPHLTVYDNIAYSLKVRRMHKRDIDPRVREIADNMNIIHLLYRKTNDLSVGEKQRVAVARTLVTSPAILLLDEPMASVDTTLRDDVRGILRKVNRMGITILHVTHDYHEAVQLAKKVGIIHNGKMLQEGEPDEVFTKPANKFVARFAGIRNFFRVRIKADAGKYYAESENNRYLLPGDNYPEDGLLLIKSNTIKLNTMGTGNENCIQGKITEVNRAENGFEVFVESGDMYHVLVSEKEAHDLMPEPGQLIFLWFSTSDLLII